MNDVLGAPGGGYRTIPLEKVREVSNIRQTYRQEALDDLAESIRVHGQLEPILVYEEEGQYCGQYCLITGHRRFRAMGQLGKTEIEAKILPKPTPVELIYLQANENEHSRTLTGQEREQYIQALLVQGESQADISRKLCLGKSWVSKLMIANEFRRGAGAKFGEAGIDLDTNTAYRLSGASGEAVEEAIRAIQAEPERKGALLEELARSGGRRGKRRSNRRVEEREFSWRGGKSFLEETFRADVAEPAGEKSFLEETFAADPGASPVKVREVMTVDRKARTILLEYDYDGEAEVVEGLSEVIRAAVEEWFGCSAGSGSEVPGDPGGEG
jgi:ParB/RepB/Spo0J family partition protein